MENVIECPVCSKIINKFVINEHVNECLNNNTDVINVDDSDPVQQNKKRKSNTTEKNVWDFMKKSNDSSERSQKRARLQVIGVTSNCDNSKQNISAPQVINDEEKSKYVSNMNVRSECRDSSSGPRKQLGAPLHLSNDVHTNKCKPVLDLSTPLAEQMRPKLLEDYVGQEKAVGKNSMLRMLLQSESFPSLLLWGPPGCGKTTLARVIAHRCKGKVKFVQLSATSSGVNDVKEVIKIAKNDLKMFRKRTILFLDEIHRFNKTQQDSLLPHVEDGTITLIGATTENPSFQVNSALLSRCRVVCLEKLDNEQLLAILIRATEKLGVQVKDDVEGQHCGSKNKDSDDSSDSVWIQQSALQCLSHLCDGDARQALNGLQMTVQSQIAASMEKSQGSSFCGTGEKGDYSRMNRIVITSDHVKKGLEKSHISYDKTGEEHYNCASALIKSMRGSDDNAALYWLARMLEGGETPLFVARRLVIFASEDVGLADNQAVPLAVSTYQACHFLGMPECESYHNVQLIIDGGRPQRFFCAWNKLHCFVHRRTSKKNHRPTASQLEDLLTRKIQMPRFEPNDKEEIHINLAHCVVYLARAPKSVESFEAYRKAKNCVQNCQGPLPSVPLHLRNAPTKLMKDIGYGKGYKYNPTSKTPVQQEYFPETLIGTNFFK